MQFLSFKRCGAVAGLPSPLPLLPRVKDSLKRCRADAMVVCEQALAFEPEGARHTKIIGLCGMSFTAIVQLDGFRFKFSRCEYLYVFVSQRMPGRYLFDV